MSNPKDLRNQRAAKLDEAQAVLDGAEAAKRGLSAEERSQYDTLMAEAETIAGDIARHERLEDQRRQEAGLGVRGQHLGMDERDVQQFRLTRLLSALANPNDQRAQKLAAFEIEACAEAAKQQGVAARGVVVPQHLGYSPGRAARLEREGRSLTIPGEVLHKRDQLVGTATAGGHLVATDLLAGSFIDSLENAMVLSRLGVTRLANLVGSVAIPRKTAGATAYWVAENSATTESQIAVDQVTMSPKTIGAFTDISRKLILQSSVDVEMLIRNDLAMRLALGIDLAGIHGSGASNQPTGVASISGIGAVAGGTNGAAPTWANIVGLETEVAVDNAALGSLAYLTNAKVRGKLKGTEKATNTAQFVWTDSATPLNGYRAEVSNQVSSTLTKGSASGVCSAIFFGDWSSLLLGLWGGLDVLVDPYTGGTAGTVRVIAFQSCDIACRHPESFAAMLDALTT